MSERTQQIDIVFDGPPGPTPGRFVEVEDLNQASLRVGRWIDRGNGLWALRLTAVVRTDAPDPDYTCGAAYCDDPACGAHSHKPEPEPEKPAPLSVFGRLPGIPNSAVEPGNFIS